MSQFGAVIVLYRPSPTHLANLVRVASICPYVVAVDNSPEIWANLEAVSNIHNVVYVRNKNVGGIAGAFNKGIAELERLGAINFFLFDQDSTVDKTFFVRMNSARIASGLDEVIIGPNIYDVNLKRYSPRLIFNKWTYKALPMKGDETGLLPCSSIISSGTLITLAAYKKIGIFREDYFIDHVDTEYCLRAGSKGVKIFINADIVLPHAIGERVAKRFAFMTFRPNNHNAVRRYYISRNGFHLCFLYGYYRPSFVAINFMRMAHEFMGIVLFEKGKFKKVAALALGLADALLCRLGDVHTLRPTAARYFLK